MRGAMRPIEGKDARQLVEESFRRSQIPTGSVELRNYADETIIVVRVGPQYLDAAAALGNRVDKELASQGFRGFVTVRPVEMADHAPAMSAGVSDTRATELVKLLTAHSRTSEVQP